MTINQRRQDEITQALEAQGLQPFDHEDRVLWWWLATGELLEAYRIAQRQLEEERVQTREHACHVLLREILEQKRHAVVSQNFTRAGQLRELEIILLSMIEENEDVRDA